MALVNWSFVSTLFLEPESCGLHDISKEELLEVAYMWKVLDHKIGIDEEFSIVKDLDFDLIYATSKLIFEQELLPYCENASSPVGIKMGKAASFGFERMISYMRWSSFISYWYKVLNINAHKLNNSKLEGDKYEFILDPIKTELTDEDKELMIKNGYNTKYIVQHPEIPFEELVVEEEDKKFYEDYVYKINSVFKRKWLMWIVNYFNGNMFEGARAKKQFHMDYLKENHGDMKFSACPFASSIDQEYHEFDEVK